MEKYETTTLNGGKLEFVQEGSWVTIYRDGKHWGSPTGQPFLRALLRDIEILTSENVIKNNKKEKVTRKKKYILGMSDMCEDIEVMIVEATSEIEAMCEAIKQKYQWDIREGQEFSEVHSIDDLITLALQGDVLVSKPIELS